MIGYLGAVTASVFAARLSSRTRTVQAWPLPEAAVSAHTVSAPSEEDGDVADASDVAAADSAKAAAEAHSLTPAPPAFATVDTAQLPDCGETVGGHCILRNLLGEGAFGRVFAAEHAETGQQLALKVVGLRRYPREYAEHELRALAAIAHPNVVQLNEHGVEAGAAEPYLWYTMPLYRGSDLAATLKAEGSLSLARAHAIFARIAGGVCEIHNCGLRHQDIKPDNIYLATMAGVAEHHPVLLDLGGAARKDSFRPLVATFPFAAPEQTEALIGGLLGDRHEPLTEKVDVYALAATLLYALIGTQLLGHDIGQTEDDDTQTPAGLVKLRSQLAVIHSMRAADPLPVGALPHVKGATRARLSEAFRRWLTPDPLKRPSASEFLGELSVLLEWDAEVALHKAARKFRGMWMSIIGGLSLAACAGGLAGYQWHKRTMNAANQATSEAQKKADESADELQRAGSNLDKIVADPTLGPVEKAKKIGEVVQSLETQTIGLIEANAKLQRDSKKAAELAHLHIMQDKWAYDASLAKVQTERDGARQAASTSDLERSQAEAARDQANRDKAAADGAKAKAEADRDKIQQDKAASDNARTKAEADRDKAQQDKAASDSARQKAEAERDKAVQDKASAEATAFARGVAAAAARAAPAAAARAPGAAGSN